MKYFINNTVSFYRYISCYILEFLNTFGTVYNKYKYSIVPYRVNIEINLNHSHDTRTDMKHKIFHSTMNICYAVSGPAYYRESQAI